ncbi:helix-turn-helix domain-containing protein [Chroococcidiopsis cubana]|uniref:helix-turn-helix domain-containing protein n=1 Tax=Chroococcidiopsis cubana TaxID=171392 RepID=UPI0018F651DA|nr:transposase family protein [Chroococcidiopsis cubana]
MGISYEQFFFLVKQVELSHKERQAETERQKVRLNARGGGRKPKLTIPEEVGLSLFYLRQMPTFEVLGMYFNVSKTEANDTFHCWLKILREVLPCSLLEQVESQESDAAIVQRAINGL